MPEKPPHNQGDKVVRPAVSNARPKSIAAKRGSDHGTQSRSTESWPAKSARSANEKASFDQRDAALQGSRSVREASRPTWSMYRARAAPKTRAAREVL